MASLAQRSFSSGELAPNLYARTDVQKYITGLRTCRNFIINREGGASYRPGFDFVAEVKDSSRTVRLIKFVFNSAQVFVLEFGNLYVRFHQNGAPALNASGGLLELVSPYATADLPTLNFAQSGDVVTLVHPTYPPYELRRLSNTSWTLAPITFGPQIGPPGVTSYSSPIGSVLAAWVLTSVSALGEESVSSTLFFASIAVGAPSQSIPVTLNWNAITGAAYYNVYRAFGGSNALYGTFGFIGSSTSTSFQDTGTVPSVSQGPPISFTGFSSANNYPAVVSYYQGRRLFANSNTNPSTVWCSQSGLPYNFNTHFPLQDNDAITFALANQEVTQVRHLTDLGKLIVGTEGGEWVIDGDASGVLTPFSVNARVGSYNGNSTLRPVKTGAVFLYVHTLATRILELRQQIQLGFFSFGGKDVSVYSTHLFDGYTITDWDYAQIPNYLLWVVRSDGTLLGFTFDEEEGLSAWHRHDTIGFFENVCTVSEGGENRLYAVVRRVINGVTRRYIERMRLLTLLDVVGQGSFLDSALEYDGRNAGAGGTTLTLTGSGWTETDPLTLTASASEFVSANVGDARILYDSTGVAITCTIAAVTSATVATVYSDKDVPTTLQGIQAATWDRAVKTVANLSTLEGQPLGVYADGFVVASPNNPAATAITAHNGQATLDRPYAHIRAGLPYLGDLETLDIDLPQGTSLKETKIAITRVGMFVQQALGMWAGNKNPSLINPLDPTFGQATAGLREVKSRKLTDDPTKPPTPITDYVFVDIKGEWNSNGRVFVRQIDPVPLQILSAIPQGFIPGEN